MATTLLGETTPARSAGIAHLRATLVVAWVLLAVALSALGLPAAGILLLPVLWLVVARDASRPAWVDHALFATTMGYVIVTYLTVVPFVGF